MRNEKGAIVLYVTIVCLFILIIAIAGYVQIANKQASQIEQLSTMEKAYSQGTTLEDEYKGYGGGDIIPISTVEQLQKIGSNEEVYIDGKIYTMGENSTYLLEQDFEFIGDFRETAQRIKDGEILINGNNHIIKVTNSEGIDEYYTEESKYYIATNKYGYVLNGLELYYDGIDNTGTGEHSLTTTTWKDLSGNGRDGELKEFGMNAISGWGNNYLSFDGVNDWVNCGELNSEYMTLDATYLLKSDISGYIAILGNWQNGRNWNANS